MIRWLVRLNGQKILQEATPNRILPQHPSWSDVPIELERTGTVCENAAVNPNGSLRKAREWNVVMSKSGSIHQALATDPGVFRVREILE